MAKDTGTVNIHGKEYKTVAKRVEEFRGAYNQDYSIETQIISADELIVVMKASIKTKDGFIVATGHAEEVRTASMINKTSALENCETSAIGRALAAFGLAGTEFASANEVQQAIKNQSNPEVVSAYQKPRTTTPRKETAVIPAEKDLNTLKKEVLDKFTELEVDAKDMKFKIIEIIGHDIVTEDDARQVLKAI